MDSILGWFGKVLSAFCLLRGSFWTSRGRLWECLGSLKVSLKRSLGDFGTFGEHFGRIWKDFGSAFGIQALTFAWSWAWLFYVCSHLPPKNMLKD